MIISAVVDAVQQASETTHVYALICDKSCWKFTEYSYSVKFSFTNIFVFGQEFNIRVALKIMNWSV